MDQHQEPGNVAAATDLAADRRAFLRRAGTAAVALGGAAVPLAGWAASAGAQEPDDAGNGDPEDGEGGGACDIDPVDMPDSDREIVEFAESAERATVELYETASERGVLSYPAEEAARSYTSHHTDHAEALRCVMGAESPAPPEGGLIDEFMGQFQQAEEQGPVIELLRGLEESLAAMYLQALGQVETPEVAAVLATIMPVDCQQALAWARAAGQSLTEYVPAFETTDGALTPTGDAA